MMFSCSFELSHYRDILLQARQSGFTILQLKDARRLCRGKFIVLRHDIDFSVEDAYRMAELERQLGVQSSFCVLLHSVTYHVGDASTLCLLREIAAMGHEIGLHYDLSFFEAAKLDPVKGILAEARYLGWLIGQPIKSVAQHRPASHGAFAGVPPQFVDAYAPQLTRDITYVSDSRRSWRSGCVHERVRDAERIQLLIHAEWWEPGPVTAKREVVHRLCLRSQRRIAQEMERYAAGIDDGARDSKEARLPRRDGRTSLPLPRAA